MKSGDKRRLAALRLTLASIKNAETAEGRATRGDLTDEEVAARLVPARRWCRAAAWLRSGAARPEMLADEKAELAALMDYLPKQLTREEIVAAARAVIAATGATGPAQTGVVMKQLMTQLKGQADGKMVSDVVRELLSK